MDFELTPEQQKVQSRARQFAEQEVALQAHVAGERGDFPHHLIKRMSELGFLAGLLKKSYGGSGMDAVSYVLLCEELGRVDSSLRDFLTVHANLVSLSIQEWGSKEQKQHYLPKLVSGEWIGCYALTEADAGSDVANLETTAIKEGAGYRLEGEKIRITNGLNAHVAIVFARRYRAPRQKGIGAFLVETDTPGFHRVPIDKELGHRASEHADITLEQCRVSEKALLGAPGDGLKIAMSALEGGGQGEAAGAVGIGQACLDACIAFVQQRRQFGQRLADFEMIQANIANMASDIAAARLLTYYAAWQKDRGEPATRATAIARLFATQAAIEAASKAVMLHNDRGNPNQYPVERYYQDIKGLQTSGEAGHRQHSIIVQDLVAHE